jgi:hypothetical protein
MVLYAVWIHGTSVQPETLDGFISIERRGFHTRINTRCWTDKWYHFAIPTPAIVSDRRLKLDSVILTFNMAGPSLVSKVHVRDGRKEPPIAVYERLNLTGDHPSERFTVPASPQVFSGIDIGVFVNVEDQLGEPADVEFSAAGANFIT